MKEVSPESNKNSGNNGEQFQELLRDIDNLLEIPVRIDVVVGRKMAKIREILELEPGYIFDLKRSGGESLMIYLSDVYFGKGEVTVIEDTFGVRLTEINDPRKV